MARIQRSKTLQPYNRIQRQPWSWGIGGAVTQVKQLQQGALTFGEGI